MAKQKTKKTPVSEATAEEKVALVIGAAAAFASEHFLQFMTWCADGNLGRVEPNSVGEFSHILDSIVTQSARATERLDADV